MKKILLVSCEGLGNGGVQAVMMSIVRKLHCEYKFDMLLFTSEKRFYDDEFLSYGGKIIRIPRYEGNSSLRARVDYYIRGHKLYRSVIEKIIENGPYDVIHCNDEFESAIMIKAAARLNIPIRIAHTHIITKHTNLLERLVNGYRALVIEKYATKKLGCSNRACESFYINSSNVLLINNTYDEAKFSKNILNKKPNNLNIIQIGSFNYIKNQIFTIRVLNEIVKRYPKAKLRLIGFDMDNYLDDIRCEIGKLNLNDNVDVLPSDADTAALLSDSIALLLPSLQEGFGIVLVEAQAMGVCCLASTNVPDTANCGGVEFLKLEDGPEVWAKKIINYYENKELFKKEFDVSRFGSKEVMTVYRKLYEDIE